MIQNEILMAMECGELSEPVRYPGQPIMAPAECGSVDREWQCEQCTLGVYYRNELSRCPLCGAEFLLDGKFVDVVGSLFPKFKCGTILNICHRNDCYFITSVSIGDGCLIGTREDII